MHKNATVCQDTKKLVKFLYNGFVLVVLLSQAPSNVLSSRSFERSGDLLSAPGRPVDNLPPPGGGGGGGLGLAVAGLPDDEGLGRRRRTGLVVASADDDLGKGERNAH